MNRAAEQLIDEALSISLAMDGAVSYETAFNSTPFERSRMYAILERRSEAMKRAATRR